MICDPLKPIPIRTATCTINFEIRREDHTSIINEMCDRLRYIGLLPKSKALMLEPYYIGEYEEKHLPPEGVYITNVKIKIDPHRKKVRL